MIEVKTLKIFPTLYKADSKGKVQFWKCEVRETPAGEGLILISHGKMGGAVQDASDLITKGKNEGKANATTAVQQALLEAEAKWTKQQERKGYVQDFNAVGKDTRPGIEPMLAHRFDQHGHKISFPAFMQPKLNGHRCTCIVVDGKAQLFSRRREQITGLPHIEQAMEALVPKEGTFKFDGELYNHKYKDDLQKLSGFIRSKTPKDGYEEVQYHIYDLVEEELGFEDRNALLQPLLQESKSPFLMRVLTLYVESEGEARDLFDKWRAEGYEGGMLRNVNGKYVGTRSYDLQKVKDWIDEEFPIIAVEEGRGKFKGAAIMICRTKEGKEFGVCMKGTMESRREQFLNKDKYIGKQITVAYANLTPDGIPFHPVGLQLRDDL